MKVLRMLSMEEKLWLVGVHWRLRISMMESAAVFTIARPNVWVSSSFFLLLYFIVKIDTIWPTWLISVTLFQERGTHYLLRDKIGRNSGSFCRESWWDWCPLAQVKIKHQNNSLNYMFSQIVYKGRWILHFWLENLRRFWSLLCVYLKSITIFLFGWWEIKSTTCLKSDREFEEILILLCVLVKANAS